MGVKELLVKTLAWKYERELNKWVNNPVSTQERVFKSLIATGKNTVLGKESKMSEVSNHQEYTQAVSIKDYEGLKPYINRIKDGEADVLWKGKPLYFAKTSGTTSGVKYIPITADSVGNHLQGAQNAVFAYNRYSKRSDFMNGRLMFLSGSPELSIENGIRIGRLSGIVNHHVPTYLKPFQVPSFETNCIEDWEEKLEKIVDETLKLPMTLISGIPPWVQMYFDKIREKTGKQIKDVFPGFDLFIYGGVNFEPYRNKLFETIGKSVPSVELFPASEGFFAYQDRFDQPGMLLQLNSGIFYEFVPADEIFNENPTRLTIGEVKEGVNYALIVNSNAGLWSYNIGDTVKFVTTFPHRLVVTGRISHYISAFGEHVIQEEVDKALSQTLKQFPEAEVVEFTVSPMVNPVEGLPHHEWLIEFDSRPADMNAFEAFLDQQLRGLNIYYDDLIKGHILRPLKISTLKTAAFIQYMKGIGKLGGQNKVPRLSNDRKLADALGSYRS